MYKLESINNSNLNLLNIFNLNDDYKEDIVEIVNNKNIFKKLLFIKNIKYIKLYDKYIGFIWFVKLQHQCYKIHCLKIISEYTSMEYYKALFNLFSNASSIRISDNNLDKNLLLDLGFTIEKTILEMKKNITSIYEDKYTFENSHISFHVFEDGSDEVTRCSIQNVVFNSISRQAIREEDIICERYEKYYIPSGCIFINLDCIPIGYAQLIRKNEMIFMANFGIVPQYRNNGYGKFLLKYMLNIASDLGVSEVYLKCDSCNRDAVKLYESEGFKRVEVCYEYKKNEKYLL
ncbi:MAG: GNAT family N-acetyltransferase [Clostridium sp.]|uniref:GNAT family N-acetyltransferase n=1 Tax=Clostridium sp. TaxID=1506 RepID=UPI00301FFC47